jgi:D-3-phosphoglycerate dehydrogenase / 2-oxoglutarate reductase
MTQGRASILLAEPDGFPDSARAILESLARVCTPDTVTEPAAVRAVFVRLAHRIDADFLARYPKLEWLVTPTTGQTHLDHTALEAAGVRILALTGQTEFLDSIRATAEHTLALLLALLRRLPAAAASVTAGEWDRYPFKGREVSGSTALIVGYGRLGRQMNGVYRALGARVIATDILPDRVPGDMSVTLGTGLAEADIVSVHVNHTLETTALIGRTALDQVKPGAVLVNTSRGEILDQPELFRALRSGRLRGAALDVLVGEPDPMTAEVTSAIAEFGPRLLITPHISGFTSDSLERVELFMSERLAKMWHAAENRS